MVNKFNIMLDNESGISPIIGVILLVAITVILSAIVYSLVLSSSPTDSKSSLSDHSVQVEGDTITLV